MFGRPIFECVVKNRASLALGGLVFALLAFAVSGCYFLRKGNIAKVEERFQMRADRIATAIETSLDVYTRALLAVEGLIETYPSTRRANFKTFIEALDIENSSPGIFALGYIERVTPDRRSAYVHTIRSDGYPDFTLSTTSTGDVYHAKYVFVNEPEKYPKPSNFDFFSDAARRSAIEQARDTGQRVATPPVILRGGAGERRAFIVFAPIYSTGSVPETLEERRAKLKGVASIAFKADVFFPNALRQAPIPDKIRVYVQDAGVAFVGGADLYLHAASPSAVLDTKSAIKTERTIDAAGRPWTISFAAPRDFGLSKLERLMPWVFLVRGLLLAIMLPVCLYVLARWWTRVRTVTS